MIDFIILFFVIFPLEWIIFRCFYTDYDVEKGWDSGSSKKIYLEEYRIKIKMWMILIWVPFNILFTFVHIICPIIIFVAMIVLMYILECETLYFHNSFISDNKILKRIRKFLNKEF